LVETLVLENLMRNFCLRGKKIRKKVKKKNDGKKKCLKFFKKANLSNKGPKE